METRETESRGTWSPGALQEERSTHEYGGAYRTTLTHSDPRRAEMIRETYRLLAVGVFAAMAAGWFGSRNDTLVRMLAGSGIFGWIVIMFALNAIPQMALKAARSGKGNATMVLLVDGIISGLVLSPLLYFAMLVSGQGENAPNLIQAALIITAAVFGGISFYVYRAGSTFNFVGGMLNGLFWVLMAGVAVNVFLLKMGSLGLLITIGIGVLACGQLVYATAQVLNNPEYDDPTVGAMILFAGLFNLFQVILSLLLRSRD